MKTKLTSTFTLSLALLGATTLVGALDVPVAHAQAPRRYSNTFAVSGALKLPRREVQIQSATLNLRRDGTFTLVLTGPRAFESSGRWTAQNNNARLQFENWNNQSASGEGRVGFSGEGNRSRVESLNVQVRAQDAEISGRFSAQDSGVDEDNGGNNNQNRSLDSTQNGGGVVRVEGEQIDRNVRSARVQLSRNGRAVTTLFGDRTHTAQGSWTLVDRNTARIQFDNGVSGRAEITLSGNSFRRIEMSGRVGGNRDFTARFSVDRNESGSDTDSIQAPSFSGASGGNGTMDIGRDNYQMRGLTARLTGNGRNAEIVLDSDGRDITLRGDWKIGLAGRYEMELEGEGITGRASMTASNGRIGEFVFKGKDGNRDMKVRFSGN